MRKPKTKIDLHHHAFGVVLVTSAGRTDAGHYLICACDDGTEPRLLTDPSYWLSPPHTVQAVFDHIWQPLYEAGLRRLRKGEWIHAMNYRRRSQVRWQWLKDHGYIEPAVRRRGQSAAQIYYPQLVAPTPTPGEIAAQQRAEALAERRRLEAMPLDQLKSLAESERKHRLLVRAGKVAS